MIVAVDGPAGSGKGTVTKALSNKLGLMNLDTGATYRCIALSCLRKKIGLDEEEKIIKEIFTFFTQSSYYFLEVILWIQKD